MLGAADLLAIRLEILHTTISSFALRGYSGDLEFRLHELGQLYSKAEIHLKLNAETGELNREVLASLGENWPAIDTWIEHPNTFLLVSFQRGRITRVRISDTSHLL